MTTPPNAAPEASFEGQAIAPTVLSLTQPFYWSMRQHFGGRNYLLHDFACEDVELPVFLFTDLGNLERS